MNFKDCFQYCQKRGTQTYGSIINCISVGWFPSLGNEDRPRYTPAPIDIKEPEAGVVNGKQSGENYLVPILNVTRDNTVRS